MRIPALLPGHGWVWIGAGVITLGLYGVVATDVIGALVCLAGMRP
ncbi:hypothetical protein ACFV5J_39880 [Streptomyces zaomyceticus]